MKIIVCGAGFVGRSIVSYLVKGNNDITVIDNNQRNLDELAGDFDVLPILGSASHPDVLEKANAKQAELLIAVTDVDEVNMIACEVAHAFFNIPRKIARIDSQDFLDPLWSTLYNDKHVPVDLIISPEIEIAKYIYRLLKIPGASENLSFFDDKMRLLSFRIPEDSPMLKTPLLNLRQIAPDLEAEVVCIGRRDNIFIPYRSDMLEMGDNIYLLTPSDKIDDTVMAFGVERQAIERVVVFGGNQISRYMAKLFEKDDNIINCKIIEDDYHEASKLAKELQDTIVINGSQMSDTILTEAGIYSADAAIAVTMVDKDNLLATMLAGKSGVVNTIALLNSRSYNNIIDIVKGSILVDRSTITISGILQELRKSEIKNAYSLGRGFGEIWEVLIEDTSPFADKTINMLDLPASSKICALQREDKIFFPGGQEPLLVGDRIILYVDSRAIRKVEKLMS